MLKMSSSTDQLATKNIILTLSPDHGNIKSAKNKFLVPVMVNYKNISQDHCHSC